MPRAELNRQVGKRFQFTLYEKIAAVRQTQRHSEVSNLSVWAACRAANFHHKQFITWKRDIVSMQEKWNKKV